MYHRTLLRLLFPVRMQKKKVAYNFRYDHRNTDVKEVDLEIVGCICLAQDRNKWWAVKNAVMNLSHQEHKEMGNAKRHILH